MERVETGGLKTFNYQKGEKKKLSNEERNEIKNAYAKYDERKKQEKRRRFFLIVLIIIILIAGLLAIIL